MRRPTIIDVAQRAGVSKSTVSLVLRNSEAVRETTRVKVRAAIEDLGYVYNRAAAKLRSAGADLIGVVINDLRNPFFTEFATSLQMALSEQGYAAVIANTEEDPCLQARVVGAMIEHGVSAVVLSPVYGDGDCGFDALARAGVPTMQVLRRVDPRGALFPFAAPDYPRGMRLATEHLLAGAPGQIAFVGGMAERSVTQERLAGYREALAAAGMEPLVLEGRPSRAFGRQAAHDLTERFPHVDAVLAFNDLIGLGLLAGFAEIGRRVGAGGVRVVGFDDIEDCAHSWPPLSSVHCDIAGFGGRVAAQLLARLHDGALPPPVTRTPVELIVRASSTLRMAAP